MRESLSPELQQAMTLDADGRYTFFIQQAVANGKLWILKDDSGCMLLNAEEEDAIPFWSDEELARVWAEKEWANCTPWAIPLKEWLDRWVKGMEEDGLAVAVFPLPEELGVLEDPAEVADSLLREMKRQRSKK